MKEVAIRTEYITLGQFLKLAECIPTGGAAKPFLMEKNVRVNGEPERRRGRKLRSGDRIEVEGCGSFTIVHTEA